MVAVGVLGLEAERSIVDVEGERLDCIDSDCSSAAAPHLHDSSPSAEVDRSRSVVVVVERTVDGFVERVTCIVAVLGLWSSGSVVLPVVKPRGCMTGVLLWMRSNLTVASLHYLEQEADFAVSSRLLLLKLVSLRVPWTCVP